MSTAQNGVVNQRIESGSFSVNATGTTEIYAGGGILHAIEITAAITNSTTAAEGSTVVLQSGTSTLASCGVGAGANSGSFGEVLSIGNLTIPIPDAIEAVVSVTSGVALAHGIVSVNLTVADN